MHDNTRELLDALDHLEQAKALLRNQGRPQLLHDTLTLCAQTAQLLQEAYTARTAHLAQRLARDAEQPAQRAPQLTLMEAPPVYPGPAPTPEAPHHEAHTLTPAPSPALPRTPPAPAPPPAQPALIAPAAPSVEVTPDAPDTLDVSDETAKDEVREDATPDRAHEEQATNEGETAATPPAEATEPEVTPPRDEAATTGAPAPAEPEPEAEAEPEAEPEPEPKPEPEPALARDVRDRPGDRLKDGARERWLRLSSRLHAIWGAMGWSQEQMTRRRNQLKGWLGLDSFKHISLRQLESAMRTHDGERAMRELLTQAGVSAEEIEHWFEVYLAEMDASYIFEVAPGSLQRMIERIERMSPEERRGWAEAVLADHASRD